MERLATRMGLWIVVVLAAGSLAAPARAAGDNEEALRKKALALNDITGDDPIKGQIKEFVDDKAGSKKLLALAVKIAKEKPQPFNYNAAYVLARTAQELEDLESCQAFYRVCAAEGMKLKSGQKLAAAYGGLIDVLYAAKKFDESEKVCKEFLEMEEDEGGRVRILKNAVLRRMIQAIAKQGKTDQAIKLADNYVEQRKDNWLAYELKGWVLREVGKYDESAKTYEEVLDRIAKDKNLEKEEKAEFTESCRYILSGIYVDMNKINKASDHLKAILADKPDDPTYNNDLGYIWADHDMNLDEAEKMIRKAIEEDRKARKKANPDLKPEEDKDNAAYLDSLGWVLFKQKKYKEAKDPLLKATQDKKNGQHIEIYDHLGDVYLALGEKAEALAIWKKGLELVGEGKREQERKAKVEKKIKENDGK
jgi:tetratricopeptide (TPR) repeat protein